MVQRVQESKEITIVLDVRERRSATTQMRLAVTYVIRVKDSVHIPNVETKPRPRLCTLSGSRIILSLAISRLVLTPGQLGKIASASIE